jgi:AraC-like DNA-binding protein
LRIKAGTLFWLFPEVAHTYAPGEETWAEQWVIFDGPLARRFERQGVLSSSKPLWETGQDPELINLWARMGSAFFPGGPLSVPLASALVHLLIVYSHALMAGLDGDQGKGDHSVQQALKIIEQEAFKGLNFRELASRLHLGYSTLRRRFKNQTGYALKEYMLGLRLRKAKELLVFTNLPVETVACEAGFEDPFYFSKLFRRRVGVPPITFRRQRLT